MEIKDKDNREFICKDGEEIIVVVMSKKTTHLVAYTLDGEEGTLIEGQPFVFDLKQSEADPTFLSLSFSFSGSTDGAYGLKITGDASGDTFTEIYRQNHVPFTVDHFIFDIWP
jgi:hypothetical protein